jgi:hypothetical protein
MTKEEPVYEVPSNAPDWTSKHNPLASAAEIPEPVEEVEEAEAE